MSGVPASHLRLTYANLAGQSAPHMVLVWHGNPSGMVLDSITDAVRELSDRKDLTPVYSFNELELWSGQVQVEGNAQQLSRWRGMSARGVFIGSRGTGDIS